MKSQHLLFHKTLVYLICLSIGFVLSSCAKSHTSSSQNIAGSFDKGNIINPEAQNAFPVIDDKITFSSVNPKAPPPPALPTRTKRSQGLSDNTIQFTPTQAQPCIYVCTQYFVNAQAKKDKNAAMFGVGNSPAWEYRKQMDDATYYFDSKLQADVHSHGVITKITYSFVEEVDVTGMGEFFIGGSPGDWVIGYINKKSIKHTSEVVLAGVINLSDNNAVNFRATEAYIDGGWILLGFGPDRIER